MYICMYVYVENICYILNKVRDIIDINKSDNNKTDEIFTRLRVYLLPLL